MPHVSYWTLLVAPVLLVTACGDTAPPAPEADAGLDASERDANLPDLGAPDAPGCRDEDGDGRGATSCGGDDCDDADPTRYPGNTEICDTDDEDCDATTYGTDADTDGFESDACCNGVDNCGTDCDDALNTVNPGAAEQCNGGIDDDCDGMTDAAEGVCVACPPGYSGFDGACTDIDECTTIEPCGGVVGATCANTNGSYVCTCPTGYSALATGGTCSDVDECATAATCGAGRTGCTNLVGSYICVCSSSWSAPATGGTCEDLDECAAPSTCGGGRAGCTNTAGSYSCACQSGYAAPATGGACANVDECTTSSTCGGARTGCEDTAGSYICTCQSGYSAPATGGTCADIDECAVSSTCGGARAGCTNTAGSYLCACQSGYVAPATGGTCIDVNECSVAPCGAHATGCTNAPSSYVCACMAGYRAPSSGGTCSDIDECAVGTTCGAGRSICVNTDGSYACTCLSGYSAPATGGACVDIDECAAGTDDCDRDPVACGNAVGTFACACPTGFAGTGRGATGCLLTDPSLASLVPSAGALSPAFAGTTTLYTLALPPGVTSVTLTPSSGSPAHATIRVNGVIVASGAASAPIALAGFAAPVPVTVAVTTDGGATRTYSVIVGRGSTYIKASNTGGNDSFSWSVALSADAATLAVGAPYEDSNAIGVGGDQANNSRGDAGAVYVFARAGGVWEQQAYVKASNTSALDWFGYAVALSADGSTLAVGAIGEASNATGIGGDQTNNGAVQSGAIYVFARTGTAWSQQAYVKASNTNTGDKLGHSLALSADGSTLAASAVGEGSNATGIGGDEANNGAAYAGAVYVFTRLGTTWSQQAYVKASNTNAGDWFGRAVALSDDGSTLAVGAFGESSSATGIGGDQTNNSASSAGAAYVFTRVASTWSQQAYVKASNTDASDFFGSAVALSGDGSTLAVGAFLEDSSATGIGGDQTDNSALDAGAVYVFTRTGTAWSQQAYVKASNADTPGNFGQAVALSADGSTLAVGALGEASAAIGVGGNQMDTSAAAAGAVYVFARAGSSWSQQAYVKASNTNAGDYFGLPVALSADGSTLAVGAENEDSSASGVDGDQTNDTASRSGAVYVY